MVAGFNAPAIDQPQAELALGVARARARQVRGEVALEALLREGAGVAEQAEPARRSATMARPRTGSPGLPVSERGDGVARPRW